MPESNDRGHSAETSSLAAPGKVKIDICRRLGDGWPELADYAQIPSHERRQFRQGFEAQAIWEWLDSRSRLRELPEALRYVGRSDLADLWVETQRQSAGRYYRDCIERWSSPRYALDKRFVQLTLLLDQGEETQGPRWHGSERFEELTQVLDRVPHQALVLLGPPGAGKSTLLRHFAMDQARAVLNGPSETELVDAPLSFWISLNDYKARRPGDPLPLPEDWLTERWQTANPELPSLFTLLREQRLTLLLDALNEMPHSGDEPIRLWKDFLQMLGRDYPYNRVIFSCRSLDYSASLSSKEWPVPQVRIEPLSDAQVQQFVELYCPEHAETLWSNLDGSP